MRPSMCRRWYASALLAAIFAAESAAAQQPTPTAEQPPAPSTTETQATPAAPPAATPAEPPVPTGAPPVTAGGGEKEKTEEIFVTGSRVRRKDLTTPAPVTVMSREQWQQSGKLTIGEFLQSMPEQGNAPNFQLNNGGATYSADGGTRINLRNLGVSRTLVLMNGRRIVNSGVGASPAPDLNSIPSAAVDRIEVLKDGASAIYGSDAISGVVNVITRRNFDATEANAQYGLSGRGDAQTFDGSLTTGRSSDRGNFLFSAGFFDQKASFLRDRGWSSNALTWDYTKGVAIPGGSFRTPQGIIGLPPPVSGNTPPADCLANPLCNYLTQTLDPSNWPNDVFVRDPSAPRGWRVAGDNDTYNFASENYLTIPSRRVQLFTTGDAKLGAVRGYYEASYVQRTSQQNAAPMPLNPGDFTLPGSTTPISVSKDSFYNPFGVDLSFAGRRLVEFGNRTYAQDLNTFRLVTGLDGALPDTVGFLNGWSWDVSFNYGRTEGTFTTGGAIRNSKIADAVGPSFQLPTGQVVCGNKGPDGVAGTADDVVIAGCVPLNLFGGPNNGSIDPAQIDSLGYTGTSRAFDSLLTVDASTTGTLFTMPSGRPLALAVGYQYRRQAGAQIADPIAASGDSADFNFKSTQGSFDANEAYAELAIPVLSDVPGVRNLEANVAGRYVHYSTFGSNFTYKLGARYTPLDDVTFRGTFSTSFRAPSISELYLGQAETGPTATDPCHFTAGTPQQVKDQCVATGAPAGGTNDTGNQETTHVGGNSNLKAEKARVFTAGVVLQPRALRDLSLTVDYYNAFVDNVVGQIGTAAIIASCYPTGNEAPQFCDLIHRAPAGTGGRILFVDDLNRNVGQLRTSGIDVAVRYALRQPFGRFGFGVDGTWIHNFDRKQTVGTVQTIHQVGLFTPSVDVGQQVAALPSWKANVGVTWGLARWSAGAVARFVASFKECAAADGTSDGGICNADSPFSRQVGTYATLDLSAGYDLKSTSIGRTSVAVGVNNVLDRKPQYVYAAVLANSDPSTYDFVGRFFYTRLTQTF